MIRILGSALIIAPWLLGTLFALAHAQQGPAAYTIALSGQQVLAVEGALTKLPYDVASPILTSIEQQMKRQVDAWQAAHPPPKPEKKP